MSIRPLDLNNDCSICLSSVRDGVNGEKSDLDIMVAKCGHIFHKTCLQKHMQTPSDHNSGIKNCPNCRGLLDNVTVMQPDGQGNFKKVETTSARFLPMAQNHQPNFNPTDEMVSFHPRNPMVQPDIFALDRFQPRNLLVQPDIFALDRFQPRNLMVQPDIFALDRFQPRNLLVQPDIFALDRFRLLDQPFAIETSLFDEEFYSVELDSINLGNRFDSIEFLNHTYPIELEPIRIEDLGVMQLSVLDDFPSYSNAQRHHAEASDNFGFFGFFNYFFGHNFFSRLFSF